MNEKKDIRYKQRLTNYCRALEMLRQGTKIYHSRPLTQLEKQGFIKTFEFTFELAWKVMKDYLAYHGYSDNYPYQAEKKENS
jgi:hypothetical protein